MNTKGRYVAFAGEDYERNGGFLDFFASHDNQLELSAKVQTFGKGDDDQLPVCWYHILDTETGLIVETGGYVDPDVGDKPYAVDCLHYEQDNIGHWLSVEEKAQALALQAELLAKRKKDNDVRVAALLPELQGKSLSYAQSWLTVNLIKYRVAAFGDTKPILTRDYDPNRVNLILAENYGSFDDNRYSVKDIYFG